MSNFITDYNNDYEGYQIDKETFEICEKIYNIMENELDYSYISSNHLHYESIAERNRLYHNLCFQNGISMADMIYYMNKRIK